MDHVCICLLCMHDQIQETSSMHSQHHADAVMLVHVVFSSNTLTLWQIVIHTKDYSHKHPAHNTVWLALQVCPSKSTREC